MPTLEESRLRTDRITEAFGEPGKTNDSGRTGTAPENLHRVINCSRLVESLNAAVQAECEKYKTRLLKSSHHRQPVARI
jgi:hypothetical protein